MFFLTFASDLACATALQSVGQPIGVAVLAAADNFFLPSGFKTAAHVSIHASVIGSWLPSFVCRRN